jgi:hypothetical protein
MYDQQRFFVMTGQHYPGTPLTIENRQEAIVVLHAALFPPPTPRRPAAPIAAPPVLPMDSEIIEKMFTVRNGADIERL